VRKHLEEGRQTDIIALVNIDMVADPRLRFMQDMRSTPWVWRILKQSGGKLGYGDLFTGPVVMIGDDHQPFVEAGIPAAVLIDLQFGPGWNSNAWWHTPQDNLENISAKSMTITGRIVLNALPDLLEAVK
jgi:glutaminyl-peptide cyclotransferase